MLALISFFVGFAAGMWLGFHPEVMAKIVDKLKR